MEYTFKLKEGRKTVPVAVFADSAYEPAGEFLLAERSFLKQINALLHSTVYYYVFAAYLEQ